MKKIKDFLKNENGAIAVIVAVGLTVLLGFTALSVDMGMFYYQKSKLQTAVDAAALAAAADLPDTTKAKATAVKYVKKNGFTEGDVTISFSEENTVVNVEDVHPVQTTFANILGISEMNVDCGAAAKMTKRRGGTSVFDYSIFSNEDLIINGGYNIGGSVRSNNNVFINNPNGWVGGNVEAVGSADCSMVHLGEGSKAISGAEPVEMPDFTDAFRQVIPTDPVFDVASHPGILVVNDSNINNYKSGKNIIFPGGTDIFLDCSVLWCNVTAYGDVYANGDFKPDAFSSTGSLYINGSYSGGSLVLTGDNANLYATGAISSSSTLSLDGGYIYSDRRIYSSGKLSGYGCVFSRGDISINGGVTQLESEKALAIYSANGDVTFNGGKANVSGMIYAPHGYCILNGTGFTFTGSIVCESFIRNGSGLKILNSDLDLPFDPPGSTIDRPSLIK